jgi:hypothetical protein
VYENEISTSSSLAITHVQLHAIYGTYRGRWRRVVVVGVVAGGGVDDVVVEAVLVHDPVGLLAVRRAALVEDERLAHADAAGAGVDGLVAAGGLPEPGRRGAVRARPRRVLLVLVAEEVPVVLGARTDPALLCIHMYRFLLQSCARRALKTRSSIVPQQREWYTYLGCPMAPAC